MTRLSGRSDSQGAELSTWIEQSAARSREALRSARDAAWRVWPGGRLAQPLAQRARHALGDLQDRSWLEMRRRSLFLASDGAVRPFGPEIWAPFVTRSMLRHVRLGDIVVDAGASVGYHALLFARRVGGRGHVFAFEPEPVQFSILKLNVEASGRPNLTLAAKAVHRETATLHLHPSDPQRSSYRLEPAPRGASSVEVHAVRLDDFFGALDRPIALMRIDLGGGEVAALEGMQSVAERNPHMKLVIHCAPESLRAGGVESARLLELIHELGFRPFALDAQAREVVPVERADGPHGFSHLLCLR